MIHLDTNFLIALEDPGSAATTRFRNWLATRERIGVCAIVWAEYLCGPLTAEKIRAVETLLPVREPFLAGDASEAARLFNAAGRRRGTMVDCMIAAVALRCQARFAPLNPADFRPLMSSGLRLEP